MTIFLGHSHRLLTYELSSRPERTRISCHTAPDKAACAPFRKERRMKFAEATKFHRKSGGAKWRACPERSRMGTCCSLHRPPDAHGSDTLPFVIPQLNC